MKVNHNYFKRLFVIACFMLSAIGFAQQKTVTGIVTSGGDNSTLPGVSIIIKGSTLGQDTSFDGDYSIEVKETDVLVFSYVGYKTQEVAVKGKSVINVSLLEDQNQLDEVVITGYTTQSTETVTTSIITQSGKALENVAAGGSAINALAGRISGVSIVQNDGRAGSIPKIQIRGGTTPGTIGSSANTPLYIVDGFVQDDPSDIDMKDVEDFTILKDAASTAIYGAQAANGVVIITTKSGKTGRFEATFSYGHEYLDVNRYKMEFLTPEEEIYYARLGFLNYEAASGYGLIERNAWWAAPQAIDSENASLLRWYDDVLGANGGVLPAGYVKTTDPVTGRYLAWKPTDWQDKTLTSGSADSYYLNLNGGTEKSKYSLSMSYYDNKGAGVYNEYKRYYINSKANFKLSDKLSSGISFRYTFTDEKSSQGGNWYQRSGRQPSTVRYYNDDGTPATNAANGGKPNPDYYEQNVMRADFETDLNFNAFLEWDIIEGLKFKPSIGLRHRGDDYLFFEPSHELTSNRQKNGFIRDRLNIQMDGLLMYNTSIKENHNIDVLLGTSFRNGYAYSISGSSFGDSTDLIPTILGSTPAENSDVSSSYSKSAVQSWFGQMSYNYQRKYLFNYTIRYDGSYKFTEKNQFGQFSGISAGWNLHNEDFWEDTKLASFINKLKAKVSYGETGKTKGMNFSDTNGAYGTNLYGGQGGVLQTVLKNDELVWESTNEFGTGIEASFLESRINLSIDYYNKKSVNKLSSLPLPAYTGFSGIRTNIGTFQSAGIEVGINATVMENDKFSWDASGFADFLTTQKTLKLPETGIDKNRIGGTMITNPNDPTGDPITVGGTAEGERWGDVYAYEETGVIQNWDEADAYNAIIVDEISSGRKNKRIFKVPGDIKWADLNGDGLINSLDRVRVGNRTPDKRFGLTNNFSYKSSVGDFGLSIVLEANLGHVVNDYSTARIMSQAQGADRIGVLVRDSFISESDGGIYGSYAWADGHRHWQFNRGSTKWYQKADYLAFRNVEVNYSIPEEWANAIGLEGLKVNISGTNLGWLTNFKGNNPQQLNGTDEITSVVPVPLTVNFGVQVKF